MTFSRVRDKISKSIRPTGPGHPRHPCCSGKMPHAPGQVWVDTDPERGPHARKAAVSPQRRVSLRLSRGHGTVAHLHSVGARPDETSAAVVTPLKHRAPFQTCCRPSLTGCSHQAGEADIRVIPVSHMGKPRTERFQHLPQVVQLGSGSAGICPQGLGLYL